MLIYYHVWFSSLSVLINIWFCSSCACMFQSVFCFHLVKTALQLDPQLNSLCLSFPQLFPGPLFNWFCLHPPSLQNHPGLHLLCLRSTGSTMVSAHCHGHPLCQFYHGLHCHVRCSLDAHWWCLLVLKEVMSDLVSSPVFIPSFICSHDSQICFRVGVAIGNLNV